jgi:hypothetical protein
VHCLEVRLHVRKGHRSLASFVASLLVVACGGGTTIGIARSGPDGDAGPSSGGNGGSGGVASGGSGGSARSSGGSGGAPDMGGFGGAMSGSGGVTTSGGAAGSSGTPGSGGAADAGVPSVCPGATPAPAGYEPCRTVDDCPQFSFYVCEHDRAEGCGPGSPPDDCTVDQECTGGQVCVLVDHSACGLSNYCAPPCSIRLCDADEVCAPSGHCGPKQCTDGYGCAAGTVCGPSRSGADAHGCAPASCSSDGYACPLGYRCAASSQADVHGCTPVSCNEGYKCPVNFDCNPTSTSLHQCDQRACQTDASCDCGACIQGFCQDRLFVCSVPPA